MTRYWKIAPGEKGFAWVEQRDHSCIAIGWSKVGDLKQFDTKEQLGKAFKKVKYESSPKQLWDFYKEVSFDDRIVASSGKYIYGLGRINDKYKYDDQLYYKHSKPVRWELKFWEPLNILELNLPESLEKRLRLNRTILELNEEEYNTIDKTVTKAKSPFEGLNNFEGILRSPWTEQEVIILFSKLSQHLKMKIEFVGTRFPDAMVRVKERNNWVTKRAEFEISSSDFEKHGHDDDECDMIICWNDDWDGRPEHIEVIELKKEMMELF